MKNYLKYKEICKAAAGYRHQSASFQSLMFIGATHLADSCTALKDFEDVTFSNSSFVYQECKCAGTFKELMFTGKYFLIFLRDEKFKCQK